MSELDMKNEMHIAMTTDDNYILQTRVTLWSVLEISSSDYIYKVHILCSRQLTDGNRKTLLTLTEVFKNLSIEFIEVDEGIFQNAQITSFYTAASFYRLAMPEVIRADRCLFLDGDLVVRTDIAEIFQIELGDYYVGGVLDCGMQSRMEDFEEHRKIIDLPTLEGYVNAGVLLWNLKKMREDNLYRDFLSVVDKGYPNMDNDVINKCCYGKIKYLNIKYNFFTDFFDNTDKLTDKGFVNDEIERLSEDDMVFHFSGRFKPWEYIRTKKSEIWWNVAKRASDEKTYQEWYDFAQNFAKQSDWTYLLGICRNQPDIIIVGFSDIGRELVDALIHGNIKDIRCFCDNNEEKLSGVYRQIPVISVQEAMHQYPEAFWIISSQNYYKQLIQQLTDLQISKKKIFRYFYKSQAYYESIDRQYMEVEKKEQGIMENGMTRGAMSE